MLDLLQNYAISDILIFIVILGAALKGVISFFDWGIERLKKIFNKEYQDTKQWTDLETRLNNHEQNIQTLITNQQNINQNINNIADKLDLLIASDKDDIKSYITEKYHHFKDNKRYIDTYSLDCLERRYKHYTNEGGNSFISQLMEELRKLPKQPPQ